MPRGLPKTCLNLLLAAMVLAGAVLPPATRHAHPGGGDLSHRHDGSNGSHQDDQSLAAHVSHPLPCDPSFASVRESHASFVGHFHFKWLCLQLTLPDHGTPANGHGHGPNPDLVFLRAGRETAISSVYASPDNIRTLGPDFQAVLSDNSGRSLLAAYSSASVTSTLLCDRARHERSGVQLI
jgi:hypothetical protein